MLKLIDLVYHSHHEITDAALVIEKHRPASGFAEYLDGSIDIEFIKHLDYQGSQHVNGIRYRFFKKRKNGFLNIPFATHRYIKQQNPDIIIVEGLIFPLQLIALKLKMRKDCWFIAQHHGEKPFKGLKRIFQKTADYFIDTYLFTSTENADEWISKNIIRDKNKCKALQEASTDFVRQDKQVGFERTAIKGSPIFLWVGRLDQNKDPLTLLKGFGSYLKNAAGAKLYMIFQTEELLYEVKKMIAENALLQNSVVLVGKVEHADLPYWFSAADFFVSASHKEGSGYALIEAMACGCIPVVSDIPSFRKITGEGEAGILFPPGNVEALELALKNTGRINIPAQSKKISEYFQSRLSYKNIADDLVAITTSLVKR